MTPYEWVAIFIIAIIIAFGFFLWGWDHMDDPDDFVNTFKNEEKE